MENACLYLDSDKVDLKWIQEKPTSKDIAPQSELLRFWHYFKPWYLWMTKKVHISGQWPCDQDDHQMTQRLAGTGYHHSDIESQLSFEMALLIKDPVIRRKHLILLAISGSCQPRHNVLLDPPLYSCFDWNSSDLCPDLGCGMLWQLLLGDFWFSMLTLGRSSRSVSIPNQLGQ